MTEGAAARSGGPWWGTLFLGDWLAVRFQLRGEEQTASEAATIERLLGLAPPARLLDVPFGDGRLALALAARGFRVTGVDLTAPLLRRARERAAAREVELELEQRDMRDLPWREAFEAAICFWGSFGYFDDEGNLEFARALCATLRPGGAFLVQTHVAETLFPQFQERGWQRAGELLVLEERRYDHRAGRVDAEWTFLADGRRSQEHSSIRLYTYRELCRVLLDAGFASCEGFAADGEEPFALGSRSLLLVARR